MRPDSSRPNRLNVTFLQKPNLMEKVSPESAQFLAIPNLRQRSKSDQIYPNMIKIIIIAL